MIAFNYNGVVALGEHGAIPGRFRHFRISPKLHGEEKTLRKRPFGIDPLAFASIPSPFAHADYFLAVVFVRALGPDRFPFIDIEAETRLSDGNALPRERTQMHFDAALRRVVSHNVPELRQ